MTCLSSPGASHYACCACHEARWQERLAAAEAERDRAVEIARREALRVNAAEARAKRMEEALEKINHGCEQSYTIRVEQGYKDLWCPDRWPDGYRCGPCIARAALAPPPEGEVPK